MNRTEALKYTKCVVITGPERGPQNVKQWKITANVSCVLKYSMTLICFPSVFLICNTSTEQQDFPDYLGSKVSVNAFRLSPKSFRCWQCLPGKVCHWQNEQRKMDDILKFWAYNFIFYQTGVIQKELYQGNDIPDLGFF